MGVLQRFERRIEELVNKPFAKAFKSDVEPVEIASALQRECDDRGVIVARGRTMVPNEFSVELGRHDHGRLSIYAGTLSDELAAMVREHADEQGYTFLGPVRVGFDEVDDLDTGMFRVRSAAVPSAQQNLPPRAPASPARPAPVGSRRPAVAGPWFELGGERYPLGPETTLIGRGADVDLRIDDPGVSRHHAQVSMTNEGTMLRDLQSTNGVYVDGERVAGASLREGNRVQLGSTVIVFHDAATDVGEGEGSLTWTP